MKAFNNVSVEIAVVLGKATMPVHQLLKMGRGAVIELDTNMDDHAEVLANNKPVARGEIVVMGENIAVSISELLGSPKE